MSKIKNKERPVVRPYDPASPPPVGFSGIHATNVVIESALPKMKEFIVEALPSHQAKIIGGTEKNRGHRVTGPLTQEVYRFLDHKYLRYYGYLDGVLRFTYIHGDFKYRNILEQFIAEFLTIVQDGGELDGMAPRVWKNGKFLSLFKIINEMNRRRDDLTCPINDLQVVRALKPEHPKYQDALKYLAFYKDNNVFGHISNKFYNLVKMLAQDVRKYDVEVQLKNHQFGYKIKKGFCNSVAELMKRTQVDRIVRITALDEYFPRDKFLNFVRQNNCELVYVDNLRALYFNIPTMPYFEFDSIDEQIFIETNLFEFVAHDYKRIGNGFYSASSAESDAMELIRNNILTIECHIRPKFNKFFVKLERISDTNEFNITLSYRAKKFITRQTLEVSYSEATFYGAVLNNNLVLTDLVRVDHREANVDITRADYDYSEKDKFAVTNFTLNNTFDDAGSYDLVLRCEFGAFRAKSIVKHKIYDPVTWFYEYVESFTIEKFERVYRAKHPYFDKMIASIKMNIKDKIPINEEFRKQYSGFNELLVHLDNRFVPPLIIGVEVLDSFPDKRRNYQHVTGDLYQLNKYYVLSKSATKTFSIDPFDVPFVNTYSDSIFEYLNNTVELIPTTFARFPDNWHDEIYDMGIINYKKYIDLERRSKFVDLTVVDENYSDLLIYQPYHHTVESEFISEFANLRLDVEAEPLMTKKIKNKKRAPKIMNG